jgi:NADH-quinone oxidoreductase subunit L
MEHHTSLLGLIILAPLVGSAVLGLFGKRFGERTVGIVACLAVLVSFVLAIVVFGQLTALPHSGEEVRRLVNPIFPWIEVTSGGKPFSAPFELVLDPLSGIYVLFVTGVGFLIHVFATGYMKGEGGYYRFFCYLNLFMFNMLVLVLGANMLIMFIGWEGVGLCSYLLIGFYFRLQGPSFPNQSAKKAFVVNRIGDVGFAIAILLTWQLSGSVNFAEVSKYFSTVTVEPMTWGAFALGGATTVAILLFVGATGKSAQIPLFVWLPDAMAGPTPVSALIHAATMVTAGVYMVSRTSEIFVHAPAAMLVVAVVGAATALFAATIGLAQWDIKKVLAYSTVSQLGYMFLACGVGAFGAGVFHVMTHAFFKALLFLGSGSVIIGMHHEQDMRKMGGLRKYMPITHATMAIGWLAICGFPLLSGFFSKDEILYQAFATSAFGATPAGKILWGVGAITALLTAIYMTRLMVLTFWTKERWHDPIPGEPHGDDHADAHHHGLAHGQRPHETGLSMTVPLMVLAVLAAIGGYVGVPNGLGHAIGWENSNRFEAFLEPAVAKPPAVEHHAAAPSETPGEAAPHGAPAAEPHDTSTELTLTVVSVVIALLGIGLGFVLFRGDPLRRMPKILEDKWRVDELYDRLIIWPINRFSTSALWKAVDVRSIDGLVNAVADGVRGLGGTLRFLQTGVARSYVAVILLGAAMLVAYFMLQGGVLELLRK